MFARTASFDTAETAPYAPALPAHMPAASPIATQSVGRTFAIAIGVLGIVAIVQLGAVGWVFSNKFKSLAAKAVAPLQKPAVPKAPAVPSVPATPAVAVASVEPDDEKLTPIDPFPADMDAAKDVASTTPLPPPSKPEPVSLEKLNLPAAVPENRFQESMQQGRAIRQRGDMNTALIRFREAGALEPANPETMAEIAMTYEKMSLTDKAAEQWRRIYEMGDAAGSYFIAAESRLKMSQTQALAAAQIAASTQPQDNAPISSLRPEATLGLGEIVREDRADAASLLKFALRVPIKARRGVKVNVQDVDILVLFYDQLDAKTIVQTGADVSYHFTSTPIDWANGEPELLEVEYNQPPVLGAKGAKRDERKYHGYVVRVYYKGELQDTHSEPDTLNAKFPAPQTLDTTANPK